MTQKQLLNAKNQEEDIEEEESLEHFHVLSLTKMHSKNAQLQLTVKEDVLLKINKILKDSVNLTLHHLDVMLQFKIGIKIIKFYVEIDLYSL
jgi:hypothetical protein